MHAADEPRTLTPAILHRPLFLAALPFAFAGFVLPIYSRELGASALEIGGLFAVFTIATLTLRPLVGWGLDHYGRRPFFVAALACYAVTMQLFGLADSLGGLYAARLMQGIAAAMLWISLNTIVVDLTTNLNRGESIGQLQQVSARAEIGGVFLGFVLLDFFANDQAWLLTFSAYAALAALGALMAWRTIPETKVFNPVLNSGPAAGNGKIITLPLLKLMVIVFITGLAYALIQPIYLIYLQDKFTSDIGLLALAFLPSGLVYSVAPGRMGKLSDRLGRVPLMALGLVGAGVLFLLLPAMPNMIWIAALFTLAAVGWAMADPAEAALVAELTGEASRGRAFGWYAFANSLGASIGPLLGGWLYDSWGQATPFYLNGALLLLCAIGVMLFLRPSVETGAPPNWGEIARDVASP